MHRNKLLYRWPQEQFYNTFFWQSGPDFYQQKTAQNFTQYVLIAGPLCGLGLILGLHCIQMCIDFWVVSYNSFIFAAKKTFTLLARSLNFTQKLWKSNESDIEMLTRRQSLKSRRSTIHARNESLLIDWHLLISPQYMLTV